MKMELMVWAILGQHLRYSSRVIAKKSPPTSTELLLRQTVLVSMLDKDYLEQACK
jgi:hypothetical protein